MSPFDVALYLVNSLVWFLAGIHTASTLRTRGKVLA